MSDPVSKDGAATASASPIAPAATASATSTAPAATASAGSTAPTATASAGSITPAAAAYGEAFADVYDDWYSDVSDVDATIACLTAVNPSNSVLELGVGTGRIAIPLARTKRRVVGIDASTAMLAKLAENIEADSHQDQIDEDHTNESHTLESHRVHAVLADMGQFDLGELFDVAFVAFNTMFNLESEQAQQSCFRCVSSHLKPGGLFFVEAIVPNLDSANEDRGITARHLDDGGIVLNATINSAAEQSMNGHQIQIAATGQVKLRPWHIHYRSPDQLDTLAIAAAMTLVDRHEDWSKTPFTDASVRHVSVYQKPTTETPT